MSDNFTWYFPSSIVAKIFRSAAKKYQNLRTPTERVLIMLTDKKGVQRISKDTYLESYGSRGASPKLSFLPISASHYTSFSNFETIHSYRSNLMGPGKIFLSMILIKDPFLKYSMTMYWVPSLETWIPRSWTWLGCFNSLYTEINRTNEYKKSESNYPQYDIYGSFWRSKGSSEKEKKYVTITYATICNPVKYSWISPSSWISFRATFVPL